MVSAQSRQRYYWTNIPGVEQPEDRGIVLRDILEDDFNSEKEKSYCLDANYYKGANYEQYKRMSRRQLVSKPKQVGKLVEKVKVRKHKVQVEALQELLLAKLKASGKSKKQIANELNDEFSTIEHYFRKVGSEFFSIPSAEHWPKLKKILKITSKKFDKQILEFEIKDGVYETKQRVYSDEGKAPTLTSGSADKLVETKPKQVGIAADINGHDVLKRVYSPEGKSPTLNTMGSGNREPKVVSGALEQDIKTKTAKMWVGKKPNQNKC